MINQAAMLRLPVVVRMAMMIIVISILSKASAVLPSRLPRQQLMR